VRGGSEFCHRKGGRRERRCPRGGLLRDIKKKRPCLAALGGEKGRRDGWHLLLTKGSQGKSFFRRKEEEGKKRERQQKNGGRIKIYRFEPWGGGDSADYTISLSCLGRGKERGRGKKARRTLYLLQSLSFGGKRRYSSLPLLPTAEKGREGRESGRRFSLLVLHHQGERG